MASDKGRSRVSLLHFEGDPHCPPDTKHGQEAPPFLLSPTPTSCKHLPLSQYSFEGLSLCTPSSREGSGWGVPEIRDGGVGHIFPPGLIPALVLVPPICVALGEFLSLSEPGFIPITPPPPPLERG